jgi:hypothetical protein
MSKRACPSEESSVSVKGSHDPTLAREWTPLSAAEERRQLEEELTYARDHGDEVEVRRISARLRLLTP